ncbi:YraN family protein [Hydrogenophaga sp. R2]|uniref:YraN family protein n=1 Tax=Hydrogenophaga sp. R2 TaxID=3132827 RepID=UPI003CF27F32
MDLEDGHRRPQRPTAPLQHTTTRERGNAAEDRALQHLQQQGLVLVARNFRTPGRGGGEIDLIMRERDGTLVFVEVRQRSRSDRGGAGASITATKRRRIVLAARHFLMRCRSQPACRFDAVLIDGPQGSLQWLRAAFDAHDAF